MTTLLNECIRTSRGKVRCDDCGQTIAVGIRYAEQTSINDGRPYRWRTCPGCGPVVDAMLDDIGSWLRDDGYDAETLTEWCRDNPEHPGTTEYLHRRGLTAAPATQDGAAS